MEAETVVVRLGGRLVRTEDLTRLIAEANADSRLPYVDSVSVTDDRHLVLPPHTVAHFANHSCDPNMWHDGPFVISTRRAVHAGEELTVDYATNSGAPGFSLPCRCGASLCRGVVTSDDWRIPEFQARYERHWVPVLARRIATGA